MSDTKQAIRNLSLAEMETLFAEWRQPKYRAGQVYSWLWQKFAHTFDAMSNIPKALREKLENDFSIFPITLDLEQKVQMEQ